MRSSIMSMDGREKCVWIVFLKASPWALTTILSIVYIPAGSWDGKTSDERIRKIFNIYMLKIKSIIHLETESNDS